MEPLLEGLLRSLWGSEAKFLEVGQRITKGAVGKGPRQKTSKIVKSVKKFFDTFRQFSRGTIFPAPFGGLRVCF